MSRFIPLLGFFLFFSVLTRAQTVEKWDLVRCVNYALEHNISVRQADLQIRFAKLDLDQSKMALYPSLNLSSNLAYGSGRNQDPTSFSLITQGYLSNGFSLQSNVDVFNWFSKKKTIRVRELNQESAEAGLEKAKNDVALNVAVAYLQILLTREQVNLARARLVETSSEMESTRKQVDAGRLPELNFVNIEAQYATDSANVVAAVATADQTMLQMKALLNFDPAQPFDVVTPPVDAIPIESLADLQPDAVYALAVKNMPQQKVDELNLQAAQKSVEVARANMYPTFSLFGSLGSTFNNRSKEIISKTAIVAPVGTVTVNSTVYQVYPLSPLESYTYGNIGYFNQLNQNFRQAIGISVSVPILNGGQLRTAWQRSKLNVKQVELQKEGNAYSLKQDIYKAYQDAVAAVEKFHAGQKAVAASQKAFEYATKRYDLGLLSTYDLLTTQNNLQSAKSQLLYAQYDYVFKMKLLEFYRGQGLKL